MSAESNSHHFWDAGIVIYIELLSNRTMINSKNIVQTYEQRSDVSTESGMKEDFSIASQQRKTTVVEERWKQ